jgi:hypothetical protein
MIKVYEKSKHRFFDELVTILSSHTFFGLAISQNASAIDASYSISLGGIVVTQDLEFFPFDLLGILVSDKWPDTIELHEEPHLSGMPATVAFTLTEGGILNLNAIATQGAFIRYFETVRTTVETNFGTDTTGWPPIWNFGRVVRNAFGHGGKIKFINPAAATVTWKTLSYRPADNGRQVMYQDIAAVDLIYLMEEMDAAI